MDVFKHKSENYLVAVVDRIANYEDGEGEEFYIFTKLNTGAKRCWKRGRFHKSFIWVNAKSLTIKPEHENE